MEREWESIKVSKIRPVLNFQLTSVFTIVCSVVVAFVATLPGRKDVLGQCIGMHPLLDAGDGETDSVQTSHLCLSVS